MIDAPGSRFVYCNGASSLLTAIIQKTTGTTALQFAKQHLFSPLGIKDIHWKSRNGITIGYSNLTLRPLDMAHFGYLFLSEGKWDNQQIISASWIPESTKKQISNSDTHGYGYQWWIMSPDIYAARGAHGQRIFVIKNKNMVVVFTSQLREARDQLPEKVLYNYIIPAVKSDHPLPEEPASLEKLKSLSLFGQRREQSEM